MRALLGWFVRCTVHFRINEKKSAVAGPLSLVLRRKSKEVLSVISRVKSIVSEGLFTRGLFVIVLTVTKLQIVMLHLFNALKSSSCVQSPQGFKKMAMDRTGGR